VNPDDFTELTYVVADGVATVTLDRPDRRNAWNGRTAVEYRWALHHADTTPDVRVVVLTGAGADFCVGADSRALGAITSSGGEYSPEKLPLPPYPDGAPEGMRRNHLVPLLVTTPVIAAIPGACAGAGFVLATYADLRFVATDARITTSFAKLGLPAEYGIGWMLPRQVGVPNALEMLYTAQVYDGEQARALGWAQRVHPAAKLLDEALAFARALARGSSCESLRMMKRQVLVDAWGELDVAYTRSVDDMNAALRHPDMREGLAALRERRPTDFLRGDGVSAD
jgi:enoyl-CoA hydratase/carnithine racemase